MHGTSTEKTDLPILSFENSLEWEEWLSANYLTGGIWMRIFKKESGITTVNRSEALDVALCYGWIDGQARKYDESSWLQKYTPRRVKSMWSKINIEKTNNLIKSGRMQERGLKEIEAAKKDGRWDRAYDSPKNMVIPEDFLKELAKNKAAEAFFLTLNKTNTYAIAWRLQTAKKPETRERRMKVILEMLANKKKLH